MQKILEFLKFLHTQKYSFLVNKIIVSYILSAIKTLLFLCFFIFLIKIIQSYSYTYNFCFTFNICYLFIKETEMLYV